jgi:hypothetical protein
MKPFILLLVSLFFLPGAQAASNAIPSQCADYARQFLFRGDYESTAVGARYWDLGKVVTMPAQGSGLSGAQTECPEDVWKQAHSDQEEYWRVKASQFQCLDTGTQAPLAAPSGGCSASNWEAVKSNFAWLNTTQDLWQQQANVAPSDGTGCNPPSPGAALAKTGAFAANGIAIAARAGAGNQDDSKRLAPTLNASLNAKPPAGQSAANKPPAVPAALNTGVTQAQLMATKPEGGATTPDPDAPSTEEDDAKASCLKLPVADRQEKYGGPKENDSDWMQTIGTCTYNIVQGMVNNVRDTFTGSWDLAKTAVVGAYHLGKALLDFVMSAFHLAKAQAAREIFMNPDAVIKKVVSYVEGFVMGIGKTVLDQAINFTSCYNNKARARFGCQLTGYLAPDIALFLIPGGQGMMLSALHKIPDAEKLIEGLKVIRSPIKTLVAAPKVAIKTAKFVGELRFVEKIGEVAGTLGNLLNRVKWVNDASSKAMVAVENGRVFIKYATDKIYEVTDFAIKRKMIEAWNKWSDRSSAADMRAEAEAENIARDKLKKINDGVDARVAKTPRKLTADSEIGKTNPGMVPEEQWYETVAAESTKNGKFLGMSRVSKPASSAEAAMSKNAEVATSQYVVKDADRKTREFTRVQKSDGSWWFESDVSALPAESAPRFPVYLDVPPSNLSGLLPKILATGSEKGAYRFEVGGSTVALASGKRMTVWFSDARQAQRFAKEIKPEMTHFNCSPFHSWNGLMAKLGSCISMDTIKVNIKRSFGYTKGSIAALSATGLKACNGDAYCVCKIYLNACIDPVTHEYVEDDKFGCTQEGAFYPLQTAPAGGEAPDSLPAHPAPASVAPASVAPAAVVPVPVVPVPPPAAAPVLNIPPAMQAAMDKMQLPKVPLTDAQANEFFGYWEKKHGEKLTGDARIGYGALIRSFPPQLQQYLLSQKENAPFPRLPTQ